MESDHQNSKDVIVQEQEINSNILASTNLLMKQDSSVWEYEAPHYFDFTKLTNQDNQAEQQDLENDKYFMVDHEYHDGDEEQQEATKENMFDQSTASLYQTPEKIGSQSRDSSGSQNLYFSAKKTYGLRETLLRALYQNGHTPLKESRPSSVFSKRKSTFRRSIHQKKSSNVTDFDNLQQEAFDMFHLDQAIDEVIINQLQVKNCNETNGVLNELKEDLDVTIQNNGQNNIESTFESLEAKFMTSDGEYIEDSKQLIELNVQEDTDFVSKAKNVETTPLKIMNCQLAVEGQVTQESASEIVTSTSTVIEEDNFHEISDQDLIGNNQDNIGNYSSINDQENHELPLNKSHRTSYVVKSPIVVNQKRSVSVHFDPSSIVSAGNETPKIMAASDILADNIDYQTPENVLAESKTLKIKNRKATPMAGILGKTSMNKERLARFQKYIKRFSRTPSNEEEEDEKNKIAKDQVESEAHDKENQKQKVSIKDHNPGENDEKEEKTPGQPKQPKKLIIYNQKAFSARKSTINRLALPQRPLTVQKKRFVSLAEQSQNFLRSARKYEPLNAMMGKLQLTRPRSPKLLTAQRSQSYRTKEPSLSSGHSSCGDDNKNELLATKTATDGSKSSKRATVCSSIPLKQKKPPTKAYTHIFCTDIRSKIYNQKHSTSHNPPQQGDQKQVFHAKPMPNFKRIQAQVERKLQEYANNRHRLIRANKPFKFESRKPITAPPDTKNDK